MDTRHQELRNDMSYFADSMRYMDSQFSALYVKYDLRAPDPTAYARPLPSSDPPFSARAPSAPAPQPGVAAIDPEEEASDDDDDDGDEEMAEGEKDDSSEEEDSSEEDASEDED